MSKRLADEQAAVSKLNAWTVSVSALNSWTISDLKLAIEGLPDHMHVCIAGHGPAINLSVEPNASEPFCIIEGVTA